MLFPGVMVVGGIAVAVVVIVVVVGGVGGEVGKGGLIASSLVEGVEWEGFPGAMRV
jgi:hypothetical protein